MKLNKFAAVLAASSMFASGAAMAEPFYMDVGTFSTQYAGDGITANIFQLSVDWAATSVYTDTDLSGSVNVGDGVVDSGIGTVSAFLGSGGGAITGGNNNEGIGNDFAIRFDYNDLTGTVALNNGDGGIVASYTSGTINVFGYAIDGDGNAVGPETQLVTLNVFGSGGTVLNALIFATVSEPLPGAWFFPPATDWSTLTVAINMRLDTNVDGPIPTDNGDGTFSRTSTLNGSAEFNRVPEPGVLALLGIGLLGLGAARRAKKAA